MGKQKRMDQVKTIIEVYLQCRSIKATARRLRISRNTVREYIRRVQKKYSDLTEVFSLTEEQAYELFYGPQTTDHLSRQQVFEDRVDSWLEELKRTGVTRQLLWNEYRRKYPQGYGYSQFCDRLKQHAARGQLTMPLSHRPAEYMQVDFAGQKMSWVDRSSGEVHDCEMLVCVLPYSHLGFVIALPSQKTEDFIHGLNQAFLFFGGVVKILLSDNLKSYVTKADRYDPTFNALCVQLAHHYGCDLDSTRVGKPRDKASVENMVRTTYQRIYAPLRNEEFYSLQELNEAIVSQLRWHNNEPFQKKEGSRQSIFESEEQGLLAPLPPDLFEVKKMTKAKVQKNYHVLLGQDNHFYSVPFRYVGKQTTVIYNSTTVEVYLGNRRIAVHERIRRGSAYQYRTIETHMPQNHRDWNESRGYDAGWFIDTAQKIGPSTGWAIGQVLVSRFHEPQSYNSCRGILRMAERYGPERLERACKRCHKAGKATYSMIKNILHHQLDKIDESPELFSPPQHDNIRGPKAYQ